MAQRLMSALETWRIPDQEGYNWAVWYGPAGPEGDVASAVVRTAPYQYRFGEVQDVQGLIEAPDDKFLVTSVTIDLDDAVQEALGTSGDDARGRLDQVPEGKKLRLAAAFASDIIPRIGGHEEWAPSLSDGIAVIV